MILNTHWKSFPVFPKFQFGRMALETCDNTSVCFGDGKFISVGDLYEFYVKVPNVSEDGLNWERGSSLEAIRWYGICYGNGKFVAVGRNSRVAIISSSNIKGTWTKSTLMRDDATIGDLTSVCFGDGKFVVVGGGDLGAISSDDGASWSVFNMPESGYSSICYSSDLQSFVAVGGNKCAMSSDGSNWNAVSLPNLNNCSWTGICYGNGKFVAIATNSSTRDAGEIAISSDGMSWNKIQGGFAGYPYGICYGNGKFLIVGTKGGQKQYSNAWSKDGVNWKFGNEIYGNNMTYTSVCYGNGKFVAVGKSTLFNPVGYSAVTKG